MAKSEPAIQLTRNEWRLYEEASKKLRQVNERDERAWEKLQERHHANYEAQRRAIVERLGLHLGQNPGVVKELLADGSLRPGDVSGGGDE